MPSFDRSAPAGLGWGPDFEQAFELHAASGLVPGRIAVQHRGAYGVYTATGSDPIPAEMSGRLHHEALSALDLPGRRGLGCSPHHPGAGPRHRRSRAAAPDGLCSKSRQ